MHAYRRTIDLCNQALEAMRTSIPAELFTSVQDLISHNEWGIGIEILIEQLYEFEIAITRQQYLLIASAMESMNLGDHAGLSALQGQISD